MVIRGEAPRLRVEARLAVCQQCLPIIVEILELNL